MLTLYSEKRVICEILGVTGTPAFFVNGRYLSGAKPFKEFAKVINAELARLNLPVPPGSNRRLDSRSSLCRERQSVLQFLRRDRKGALSPGEGWAM